jgi:phage portal protein BeeE
MLARVRALLTRDQPADTPAPFWLHPYYAGYLGGPSSLAKSAEPVTPQTAQGQATAYACVSLISGALAAAEWNVVRMNNGARLVDRAGPTAKALASLDAVERRMVVWDTWSTGNAFILKWRDSRGGVGELERLVVSQMTIRTFDDGMPAYRYADPYTGRMIDYGADDLIHVRYLPLGLWPIVGGPALRRWSPAR